MNQDGKRTVIASARSRNTWLVHDGPLPENLLLQLPAADRAAIMTPSVGRGNGGQHRINYYAAFTHRPKTAITAARQLDGPERVRDARRLLRDEGIVMLATKTGTQ